jgi:hypothetical protein
MRWTEFRLLPALAVVLVALGGCAKNHSTEISTPDYEIIAPVTIPLALRSHAAIIRISFPQTDQRIEPGQFNSDELCYIDAGDFRIDCRTDGSSLSLGPTDSNDLLTDNPMSGLAPLHNDMDVVQTMKLYGLIFLIGGSVDRLPAALAEYIQGPGPHLTEALELADTLLNQKRAEFNGHARGGNFTVSIELTTDGRDKLMDALDEIGQTTSPTQLVALPAQNKSRKTAPKKVIGLQPIGKPSR